MDSIPVSRQVAVITSKGASLRASYSYFRHSRLWMALSLVLTDTATLFLAGTIATVASESFEWIGQGRTYFGFLTQSNAVLLVDYLKLSPLLIVFLGTYAWRGLIPAIGMSPSEEFRRLSASTSVATLVLAVLAYIAKSPAGYTLSVLGLTWLLALVLVPSGRTLLRKAASRAGIWGEPVAIIGYGHKGRWIAEHLLRRPTLGLRPVVAIDGYDLGGDATEEIPVIQVGTQHRQEEVPGLAGVKTAIFIMSEVSKEFQDKLMDERQRSFRRVIAISDVRSSGSPWVRPLNLGGVLGLEVRQSLANDWEQKLKRILDIVVVCVGFVVVLPFSFLIAFLIWRESRGGIFYGHTRIGKDGRKFKVWKFRTMVEGADQLLESYLDQNPKLQSEWDTSFKIQDDPRTTKIGRVLRRTSLDELPQIWNVLKGEMSLVGPRPIVAEEVSRYGTRYRSYTRVRPGITGIWQVSGRNNADYEYRVRLDDYYVRNWSLLLDIYILSKTPLVVLRRKGAY